MNARNDVKKPFHHNLAARRESAQRRFAARVDLFVARWLQRCAANAEATQHLFRNDQEPARGFGLGVRLVSSPHESP